MAWQSVFVRLNDQLAQVAGISSSSQGCLGSSFLMKQRRAAAAQCQKLRFVQSVAIDRCAIALPIERTMPPGHGPEETVKKMEGDAEIAVHKAFAIDAPVMNVVHPSGLQEP